jgi:hypothetical protein
VETTLATAPTGYYSGVASAPAPSVAYNGQDFLLAWSDTHATGDQYTALVYVATLSTAGIVTNTHTISGTLTDVQVSTTGDQGRTYLSVGPTSALLAYRLKSSAQVRYWILDTTLTSVLAGPFDNLTGTDERRAMQAAHVGSSFALATQSDDTKTIRVHRIDDQTGKVLASTVITNPAGGTDAVTGADADMAAVGSGFAITMSRGVDLGYAWAREDLAGGFAFTETNTASATSGRIAPIDAKHVAITWGDGAVKAAILTCSP